jgi:hypothetical protein
MRAARMPLITGMERATTSCSGDILGVEKTGRILPDELLGGISEGARTSGVRADHGAVEVDRDQRIIVDVLGEPAHALLAARPPGISPAA